jgi:hypothetical protein
VVPTPLKNISQFGSIFPIHEKMKNVPNHQPDQGFIWGFFRISFRDSLGFHLGFLEDLHFIGVSFRVSLGFL